MQRTANSNQAYTNFVVGNGGTVYQMKRPGTVAWGAGTTANQNAPVQIELGHAANTNEFRADYQAYVALARDMAGKYGIPLTLDQGNSDTSGVKSHRWLASISGVTTRTPMNTLFGTVLARPSWPMIWQVNI
ncbi:MAG: peptidoglycan recognition family protein [Limosilactobacillus pontis]